MRTPYLFIEKNWALVLSIIFFSIHLPWIGLAPLWGSSEAREAHVVSTIYNTGEWILPLRNGLIPSKPPLFHWLGAISAFLFGGPTLFAVRFISLLSATITMFTTLWIGEFLWRRSRNLQGGDTKALLVYIWFILASTYAFLANVGDAKVDMTFASIITVGVAGFIKNWIDFQSKQRSTAFWWLWISLGFSVLTKGPLGAVLLTFFAFSAAIYISGWQTAIREFSRIRLSLIIGIILAGSWYLLALQRGGKDFFERQIMFENLHRFSGGDDINSEVWWFYILSLLRTAFPWSVIGFGFLVSLSVRCRAVGTVIKEEQPKIFYLGFILCGVGLILLSIPSGKRHSYLLPLIPWLTLSVSFFLFEKVASLNLFYPWVIKVFNQAVKYIGIWLACLGMALFSFPEALTSFYFSPRSFITASWLTQHKAFFLIQLFVLVGVIYIAEHTVIFNRRWKSVAICILFLGTISLGYYIGIGIKGELKNFSANAENISLFLDGRPLTVLKGPGDEYFDPFFRYFSRQVRIREEPHECGGIFLAEDNYLAKFTDTYVFHRLKTFGEIPEKFNQPSNHEIVLVECTKICESEGGKC